ncbi:uncharacterized protein LOC133865229 [Alnus glutinosa]|uniref:uncharacterized protein LOC133865229 n=1 Tax=Alnus glutinosa TaxID=3517 RepID=UPI002D765EB7|nr:uncharacterized protein LOC133865229 [Alnus glutinosa]
MNRSLLKHVSLCARNLLLSPSTYRPNPSLSLAPLAALTLFRVGIHSFDPVSLNKLILTQTQDMVFVANVEDVSDEELKKRRQRCYADFSKASPSPLIFKVISMSKLAGKHDEADKKVMEEICGKREDPLDDIDDEESNSNVDESSSKTDEDFDESHGKKTVRKTRARDE